MYDEVLSDQNPRKTLSIVQFTDMHLDLEYTVGSNKTCNNVLCCRADDGFPEDPSQGAGEFGSIAWCDIPPSVVFKMGDKINELAPDLLFWTGDAVPHDQWEYSLEHVQKYQDWLVDFIKTHLSQWSIVPLEGNHDFGEVINSQDFTQTDPMITYNLNLWRDWLTPDAQEQFAVNGFYSMPLTTSDGTLHEKVRVIAVNTEACYNFNFFLMKLRDDPGDQL